jgi:AcrR family transcriptional regulator
MTGIASRVMSKLRQSERTELSDHRMIDTAIELIVKHGISKLRLTEVGLRAGYSRGLAAMRFGTMHGLLRRVAEHLGKRWSEALNEELRGKQGLAAVYAAIDTQERWLTQSQRDILGQYLIFFHSMDPGTTERLHAFKVIVAQRRDLGQWICDAIAAGEAHAEVDCEAEATAILSSMIGIVFQVLIDPGSSAERLCGKLKVDICRRLAIAPTCRRKGARVAAPG